LERYPTCSAGEGGRTSEKLRCGAVDYVCFLGEDGDEFPDTGHIRHLAAPIIQNILYCIPKYITEGGREGEREREREKASERARESVCVWSYAGVDWGVRSWVQGSERKRADNGEQSESPGCCCSLSNV
jgi:hypothetical protein